jgi:hypothetical protein
MKRFLMLPPSRWAILPPSAEPLPILKNPGVDQKKWKADKNTILLPCSRMTSNSKPLDDLFMDKRVAEFYVRFNRFSPRGYPRHGEVLGPVE